MTQTLSPVLAFLALLGPSPALCAARPKPHLPVFDDGSGAIQAHIKEDRPRLGAKEGEVRSDQAQVAHDQAVLRSMWKRDAGYGEERAQLAADRAELATDRGAAASIEKETKGDRSKLADLKRNPKVIAPQDLDRLAESLIGEDAADRERRKAKQKELADDRSQEGADVQKVHRGEAAVAHDRDVLRGMRPGDPGYDDMRAQLDADRAGLAASRTDLKAARTEAAGDRKALLQARREEAQDTRALTDLNKLEHTEARVVADQERAEGASQAAADVKTQRQLVAAQRAAVRGAEENLRRQKPGTAAYAAAKQALAEARGELHDGSRRLAALDKDLAQDRKAAAELPREKRELYGEERRTDAAAGRALGPDSGIGGVPIGDEHAVVMIGR